MISVVVSSYNQKYYEKFSRSLHETIGVAYELIKIDNPGLMGLSEAYNSGAAQAKYDYICFVHEDIIFKTCRWGNALIKKFKADERTGLIGVAGSTYKSLSPGMGWFNNNKSLDYLNILQHHANKDGVDYDYQIREDFNEVMCLDGVFLFTKKSTWQETQFDSMRFKKFHFYDIDFSLSVALKYKIFVTNQVLLEHFSDGNYSKAWQEESLIFIKKWRNLLPQGKLKRKEQISVEWDNKQWFLNKLKASGASFILLLKLYFGFGFFKFFSFHRSYKTAALIFKSFIFG